MSVGVAWGSGGVGGKFLCGAYVVCCGLSVLNFVQLPLFSSGFFQLHPVSMTQGAVTAKLALDLA